MIIQNDGNMRVEVQFYTERRNDEILVSQQVFEAPVTGRGVAWRQGKYTKTDLFKIDREQMPELIQQLAFSLLLEDES